MNDQRYRFKLGMFLNELRLPFDEALATARDIGAEYVWFSQIPDEPEIAEMNDAEIDRMAERVAEHDLRLFLISALDPFKQIHLTDIDAGSPMDNEEYQRQFNDLVRSMMMVECRRGYGLAIRGLA